MPSTRLVLVSVVLLAVAGCLGVPVSNDAVPGAGAGTGAGTGDPTTPTTPSADVVEFSDLPDETKPVVRTAVETGSVRTVEGRLDGLEPEETAYLRYDGTRYALTWRRGGYRARYSLNEVQPANASSVGPGYDVADYEDLSEEGRRLFDAALAGDPSGSYDSTAFPGELTHVDYVVYEGTHYRLLVVVGDVPEVILNVEPADSGGSSSPTSRGQSSPTG